MSIFGQPSVPVNLTTGKLLDNFVQPTPKLALCTTPDKEGEPGLPVNIFRHDEFVREHRLEDPRHLWIQAFNGKHQNRRAGYHAELPDPEPVDLDERWEPVLEPWQRVPEVSVAEVYETFAPLAGVRCCIAGGACRDELLGRTPKDYDVFCFGKFDRGAILTTGCEMVSDNVRQYAGVTLSQCFTVRWRGVDVQFVYRGDCCDVDSLLDSFDWAFCQFAFDDRGFVKRFDVAKIGDKQELRLNPIGDAKKTCVRSLRRGFEFAKRFDMQINDGDLAVLCAEIVEQYAQTRCGVPSSLEIVKG